MARSQSQKIKKLGKIKKERRGERKYKETKKGKKGKMTNIYWTYSKAGTETEGYENQTMVRS
jgi:hypothetical protein